jgi:hypothetical protein
MCVVLWPEYVSAIIFVSPYFLSSASDAVAMSPCAKSARIEGSHTAH